MCEEYTYPALFWTFAKNYARLELRSLFHSLFATLRLRGRLARDGFSSALWDCFGGLIFNMANLSPKTVPQCTFTTISTRSPAQPQSGESDRAHFELLSHETLAKLNVGAMAFESISLLLPNLCLGLFYSFCLFCLDGMPAGRLEVMLSYSDTPDAPVAHAPLKKRSILKRFSSNSNL